MIDLVRAKNRTTKNEVISIAGQTMNLAFKE